MERSQFYNILSENRNGIYMQGLIAEVNKMNEQNLSVLLQYADKLFEGVNSHNANSLCRIPTLVARALNEGKSTAFIDDLARTDTYAEAARKYNIEDRKQQNVTGQKSSFFAQTSNVNINDIPLQGWKFHISAESIDDYNALCHIVIPELDRLGVAFKMVQPEKFIYQLNSEQIGKAITIYPSPGFDINNFSQRAKDFLLSDPSNAKDGYVNTGGRVGETQILSSIKPKTLVAPEGDMQIKGRIFARYGSFRGSTITTPDGKAEYDPKKYRLHQPNFMPKQSASEILGFYSDIQAKYNRTQDKKTYMQEYFTMCHSDGKSHAFVALEIDARNTHIAEKVLNPSNNAYGLSLVVNSPEKDGKAYVLVHTTSLPYLNSIQDDLSARGVENKRPEWDIKMNRYEIDPKHANIAETYVQKLQQEYGKDMVSITYRQNGSIMIKCDTTLDSTLKDFCQYNEIDLTESNLDMNKYDVSPESVPMAKAIVQTLQNNYGIQSIFAMQESNGKYTINCSDSIDSVLKSYCAYNNVQLSENGLKMNKYEIPRESVPMANSIVQALQSQYGAYAVSLTQNRNGSATISCAYSIDSTLRDYCSYNNVQLSGTTIKRYEIAPQSVYMAQSIAQTLQSGYGENAISLVQTNEGKFVIKCNEQLDSLFLKYCNANNVYIAPEASKTGIRSFVEKLTGKDLSGERDVTNINIQQGHNMQSQDNQYYDNDAR